MTKPMGIREHERALWEEAAGKCARGPDGGLVEIEVEDELVAIVPFDVDKAKRKRAKEIISSLARPGSTDPVGQLTIPGLEPYLYEPNRLVRNESGRIIENENATIDFKQAEAMRAREHEEDVRKWATRKTVEAERFAKWALDQALKGRRPLDLTWSNCIKENGYWSDADDAAKRKGQAQ